MLISLYDYLGYPAGRELGKQVANYGKIRKTSFGRKQVNTKTYNGEVILYLPEFLDEFFTVKKLFEPINEDYTEVNTQLTQESWKATETGVVF